LAKARAIAAPIPFEAPVTIATFPVSSPMIASFAPVRPGLPTAGF
jgi:hypothetical protein